MGLSWQLSGVEDADGRIGRYVPTRQWRVPSMVYLDGGDIVYGPPGSGFGPKERWLAQGEMRTASKNLLGDFRRLDSATDEQVLRFARREGVLLLCRQHGLPVTHLPTWVRGLLEDDDALCRPRGGLIAGHWRESTDEWRHFARQVTAIVDLAVHLRGRQPSPVAVDDWPMDVLRDLTDLQGEAHDRVVASTRLEPSTQAITIQRRMVASYVDAWLRMGDVSAHVTWEEAKPDLDFGGGSLTAALATQLALAVAGQEGFATCSECRRPYIPHRRPPPTGPHYCPQCRKTVPKREYARRRRAATS